MLANRFALLFLIALHLLWSCSESLPNRKKDNDKSTEDESVTGDDKSTGAQDFDEVEETAATVPANVAGAFLTCYWGPEVDDATVQVACAVVPEKAPNKGTDTAEDDEATDTDDAGEANLNLLSGITWRLLDDKDAEIDTVIRASEISGIDVLIHVPVDQVLKAKVEASGADQAKESLVLKEHFCELKQKTVIECLESEGTAACLAGALPKSIDEIAGTLGTIIAPEHSVRTSSLCTEGGTAMDEIRADGHVIGHASFFGGTVSTFSGDAVCSDKGIRTGGFMAPAVEMPQDIDFSKGKDCFLPIATKVSIGNDNTERLSDFILAGPRKKEKGPFCFFMMTKSESGGGLIDLNIFKNFFGTMNGAQTPKGKMLILKNPQYFDDARNDESFTPEDLVATAEKYKCKKSE